MKRFFITVYRQEKCWLNVLGGKQFKPKFIFWRFFLFFKKPLAGKCVCWDSNSKGSFGQSVLCFLVSIFIRGAVFIHRTYSFPVGQKSDGSKGLLKEDLIIICIDKRYIADEVIAGWLDSSLGCSLALYKNWPISWTDDKLNDSMTALAALCHHQRWAVHTCNDASLPWTPKSYNYNILFPFFHFFLFFSR